jgi:hypothetical protein
MFVRRELVDIEGDDFTIISGAASGALDSESKEADEHAKRFYEAIRNRRSNSDVKSIARNVKFPEKVVKDIKNHIFLDKHDVGDGKVERFEPLYEIAMAWDRLIQGKHTEFDIMLLKHELVELTQMKRHGYGYWIAHEIANKYHNWDLEFNKQKNRRY